MEFITRQHPTLGAGDAADWGNIDEPCPYCKGSGVLDTIKGVDLLGDIRSVAPSGERSHAPIRDRSHEHTACAASGQDDSMSKQEEQLALELSWGKPTVLVVDADQ